MALHINRPDPAVSQEVFDLDFQSRVSGLLNQKQLRFDGHGVHLQHVWTHSSWLGWTWMPAPETDPLPRPTNKTRCFIAIEASVNGAVAVYFERPGEPSPYESHVASTRLGRLLNYWVRGAWEMAFSVAHMIGHRGSADGVTLVASSAVAPSLKKTRGDRWPSNSMVQRYRDDCLAVYHDELLLIPETVQEEFALDSAFSAARKPMESVHAYFSVDAYGGDLGFTFT